MLAAGLRSCKCNVNVNNLLAISIQDFDNSGEPGPQAKGVNHLETPLGQLHITHRASSCAKRGGHVQLCSKPRGARGIEPETFRRRGQLLTCPPTTGLWRLIVGTQRSRQRCGSLFRALARGNGRCYAPLLVRACRESSRGQPAAPSSAQCPTFVGPQTVVC